MLYYDYFPYFYAIFGIKKNRSKFHCVSDLQQHLVNVWQSAAESH